MPVNQVNLDDRRNNYISARRFVSADERRLFEIANKAVSGPEYKKKESKRNNLLLLGLPLTIIASAAAGVKAKSGHLLSSKVLAGAGALTYLTGFAAILTAVFAGEKALISNSSTLEDAHKKHPFISLVADFAVAFGAANAAGKGIGKLAEKYAKKFPETLENIKNSLVTLQKEMDKTALNKKLLKNVSKNFKEFSKNHQLTSALLKSAVKYSPFLLIGGYIGAGVSSAKHRAEKRDRIFMDLKDLQLHEAKNMIKGLEHGNRNLANACVAEKIENKELNNKLAVAEMKQEKEDM